MLHSIKRKPEKNLEVDGPPRIPPAIQLVVVRDESFPSRGKTPHFRYVALRIMELELAVDSATIQILLSDLTEDLGVVTPDQKLCLEVRRDATCSFNNLLISVLIGSSTMDAQLCAIADVTRTPFAFILAHGQHFSVFQQHVHRAAYFASYSPQRYLLTI